MSSQIPYSLIPLSDLPRTVPGSFDTVVGIDESTGEARRFPMPVAGESTDYATRADLPNASELADGTSAYVNNDADPENNGRWAVFGGEWVKAADRTTVLVEQLDRAVAFPDVSMHRVPLFVDRQGAVPLWLEGGKLAGVGVAEVLISSFLATVTPSPAAPGRVPLLMDANGAVPLWLEDGFLAGVGVTESFRRSIGVGAEAAPANQPLSSKLPVATDGRGLWAWKAKLAMIARGEDALARMVMVGDSWIEYVPIPAAVVDVLTGGGLPRSGLGWISVRGAHMPDGVTFSRSGFDLYDASTGDSPVYGAGIDGHYIYTSSATAVATISNCPFTTVRIYYRNHGGTFRWRVDGGAWSTVTANNTGALGIATESGLPAASHTIEIDTAGNAGTVVICGVHVGTADPGFEVLKAGNGNLDAQQYSRFIGGVGGIAQDLQPDLVVMCLGTNDYTRAAATPEIYVQTLAQHVQTYRASAPDCGFIFIAPADSNRTAARPLTEYRDAAYRFAIENGHEFYNMHDEWPGHARANAAGLWEDNAHVNDNGARLLAERIHTLFLEN